MNELENKIEESLPATPVLTKKTRKSAHEEVLESPSAVDTREARKKATKEKWMRERDHKSKLVTGKFLFNECPGGELRFVYLEFPGEKLQHYAMRHDTIHTIPLGVAQHLNDNCSYFEYQHNLDAGKAINAESMYIASKVHRTNFIPLDFTMNVGNHSGKSIAQVTMGNPLDNRYNLDAMGR